MATSDNHPTQLHGSGAIPASSSPILPEPSTSVSAMAMAASRSSISSGFVVHPEPSTSASVTATSTAPVYGLPPIIFSSDRTLFSASLLLQPELRSLHSSFSQSSVLCIQSSSARTLSPDSVYFSQDPVSCFIPFQPGFHFLHLTSARAAPWPPFPLQLCILLQLHSRILLQLHRLASSC